MDCFFVYLLLFTEIALLGLAWRLFDGDIISPSIITLALFILSTACFAYNAGTWITVCTLKCYTFFSMVFICMIGTEYFVRNYRFTFGRRAARSRSAAFVKSDEQARRLYIAEPYSSMLFIILIACAVFYLYKVIKTGLNLGASGILMAIGTNKDEGDYDVTARLLFNIVRMSSYVYIVMFSQNVFRCKESVRRNMQSAVIICVTVFIAFFSGQRSCMIGYVMAVVISCLISLHSNGKKENVSRRDLRKFYRKIFIAALLLIFIFYLSANVVKGVTVKRAFTDYMTYYFGSTTNLMCRIIEDKSLGHSPFVGYFGEKTFMGFWTDMFKYGVVSMPPAERRFVNMGDRLHPNRGGNEFTFLHGPYVDFGFFGALIFVVIFYAVLSHIYYNKVLRAGNSIGRYINTAIYLFLSVLISMAFYQDTIRSYSRLLNILYIIYIIVFCKLFLRERSSSDERYVGEYSCKNKK